jgi:uncharacterized membrane protein YdbT with pleckstrin-like domain
VTILAKIQTDILVCKERKRWGFFGIPFTFTTYTLFEKKLTVKSGFFSTKEDDILLFRIRDTGLTRSLGQKLFRMGSVTVCSSDSSLPELTIKNIKNYRTFKEMLDQKIDEERIRMRFRANEVMGANLDDECAAHH